MEAYVDALGTKEDFFNAIVQERAWEFGGEKHRRYDLARWNLYGKTLYNLYFDWIELGKVARTKQYENTTTPFEDPTYNARFDSYPAVAYYKMVPADKTLFPVCVAETMDWYKEGDVNSYDEALPAYPSKNPTGYSARRYVRSILYASQKRQPSPVGTVCPYSAFVLWIYQRFECRVCKSRDRSCTLFGSYTAGRVVEPSGIIEKLLWILKLTVG